VANITPAVILAIQTIIEDCTEEDSQAKALVQEGLRPGSILAPFFTHDETAAAYAWNIHEARTLLVRVKVKIRLEGPRDLMVRAFIKTSHEQPGYHLREQVATNPALKQDTEARFCYEVGVLCARFAEYGVPQVNRRITQVCKALQLPIPTLFDGSKTRAAS
jgi:hypothetical protein